MAHIRFIVLDALHGSAIWAPELNIFVKEKERQLVGDEIIFCNFFGVDKNKNKKCQSSFDLKSGKQQ